MKANNRWKFTLSARKRKRKRSTALKPAVKGPVDLDASITRILFRNDESGWSIVKARVTGKGTSGAILGRQVTLAGEIPFSIAEGISLTVHGEWTTHPKYGRQIEIGAAMMHVPTNISGLAAYLGSGILDGIGPKLAERIVEKFGAETLAILDNHPERLIEIFGIGETKLAEIAAEWHNYRKNADAYIRLAGMGFSVFLIKKLLERYRNDVLNVVEKTPYRLVEVDGVGFATADRIALAQGVGSNSPERAIAAAVHSLQESAMEGHCYLPVDDLIERTASILERNGEYNPEYMKECAAGVLAGTEPIVCKNTKAIVYDAPRFYRFDLHVAERKAAKRLRHLMSGQAGLRYGKLSSAHEAQSLIRATTGGTTLNGRQCEAVAMMLDNDFSILHGLPGTGKTTAIKKFLDVLDLLGQTYTLCAPTGKAARRLKEATGRDASTIHRLLYAEMAKEAGKAAASSEGENPMDADYVVIDESSMIDVKLLAWFTEHVKNRLVVIGDPHQLPSVGPGNCLRDIIGSELAPVIELTDIQRQAAGSPIIQAAHSIHQGKSFYKLANGTELVFIETDSAQEVQRLVLGTFQTEASREGLDNVQILSPMRKGYAGTEKLNAMAQTLFTGQGKARFRAGDKVIHIKNNYRLVVMNGEVGKVISTDSETRTVVVRYADRDVRYRSGDIGQLRLAYAITVHKSQGSEFDSVIIPVSPEHHYMFKMTGRNLIYTAVTRAKKRLIVIGAKRPLAAGIATSSTEKRYTALKGLLQGDISAMLPADLNNEQKTEDIVTVQEEIQ